MRRVVIRFGVIASVAAMCWPVFTSPPRDSFPLSDYPMFATGRPAEAAVATVVAVDSDGTVRRLDPRTIGGTDQPVQAAATVNRAIRDGRGAALCDEVARGVPHGATVEVVTEVYDAVRWFRGEREPLGRTVHATCPGARAR